MSNSLFYKLFGAGKVPKQALEVIEQEGIEFIEEGLKGSVTFRNVRAPGRIHNLKRSWFRGSLVLTKEHFLAFSYTRPAIGVAWKEEKIRNLDFSLLENDTLSIKFDAAKFHEDWTGEIEYRYSTPSAKNIFARIQRNMNV